jgi:hypothetical protein
MRKNIFDVGLTFFTFTFTFTFLYFLHFHLHFPSLHLLSPLSSTFFNFLQLSSTFFNSLYFPSLSFTSFTFSTFLHFPPLPFTQAFAPAITFVVQSLSYPREDALFPMRVGQDHCAVVAFDKIGE